LIFWWRVYLAKPVLPWMCSSFHELLVVEMRAYLDSALVTKIIGRRMNPKITRTGRIETEAEAAHRSGRKVEERFCIRQFGVQPIGQYVMIFWRLYDFL